MTERWQPFPNNRRQWLDARRGDDVAAIAASAPDAAAQGMAQALRGFVDSPTWQSLLAQRDDDFHRCRYESPFVSGINKSSMWADDPVARTRTLSFGGGNSYTEARTIVADVCRLAHNNAVAMASLMAAVREGFVAALPYLSGGVVTLEPGPEGGHNVVINIGSSATG